MGTGLLAIWKFLRVFPRYEYRGNSVWIQTSAFSVGVGVTGD